MSEHKSNDCQAALNVKHVSGMIYSNGWLKRSTIPSQHFRWLNRNILGNITMLKSDIYIFFFHFVKSEKAFI